MVVSMGLLQGVNGLFLQFAGFANVGDLLYEWDRFGVFDFVLPFLLLFALIFGILTSSKILGGNKGINVIIALVIALMALRLEFVSIFFTELFPRFALGLVSLVIAVILIGLFIPPEFAKGWFTAFGIIGALIALAVVVQTFSTLNYFGSYFWQEYAGTIIVAILVIAAIVGVVISANAKPSNKDLNIPIKALRGE